MEPGRRLNTDGGDFGFDCVELLSSLLSPLIDDQFTNAQAADAEFVDLDDAEACASDREAADDQAADGERAKRDGADSESPDGEAADRLGPDGARADCCRWLASRRLGFIQAFLHGRRVCCPIHGRILPRARPDLWYALQDRIFPRALPSASVAASGPLLFIPSLASSRIRPKPFDFG